MRARPAWMLLEAVARDGDKWSRDALISLDLFGWLAALDDFRKLVDREAA
jgi:hypothetical protein